jgi:hypothetical protein
LEDLDIDVRKIWNGFEKSEVLGRTIHLLSFDTTKTE